MATIEVTQFTRYSLTQEEYIAGQLLTQNQKYVLQNLLTSYLEEKVKLTIDATNPYKSLQQEAELHGSILAIQYILTASEQIETQQIQTDFE